MANGEHWSYEDIRNAGRYLETFLPADAEASAEVILPTGNGNIRMRVDLVVTEELLRRALGMNKTFDPDLAESANA